MKTMTIETIKAELDAEYSAFEQRAQQLRGRIAGAQAAHSNILPSQRLINTARILALQNELSTLEHLLDFRNHYGDDAEISARLADDDLVSLGSYNI